MSPLIIKCACGKDFTFSDRDQKFYSENFWPNPKRCRDCREKKKKDREAAERSLMPNQDAIDMALDAMR